MNEDAHSLVRAAGLMVVLTIGSYWLLKALPGWEITAAGMRDRALAQVRAAQAWNRARNEVLFEAYTITREAAPRDTHHD